MKFGIIDLPHAVNTETLVYALEAMLDQEAQVIDAQCESLPEVQVYVLADNPGLIPDGMQLPAVRKVLEVASAKRPLLVLGEAVVPLVEAGLLPGGICAHQPGQFSDTEWSVRALREDSILTCAFDAQEVVCLPCASEPIEWCLHESELDGGLLTASGFKADRVVAAQSDSAALIGVLVRPERAVDDETGNTDGRKVFWSIVSYLTEK